MQATAALDIYEECRRNGYKEIDGEYHQRAEVRTRGRKQDVQKNRITHFAPEVTYLSLDKIYQSLFLV